jgi:uncharacterized YccA/Bax inhibitor family protein
MMQTTNPAFSGTIFGDWEHADRRGSVMTVQGTAAKSLALLIILVACAAVSWSKMNDQTLAGGVVIGSAIAGLVLAIITVVKKPWAGFTAPVYAACEGVFLGAISQVYNGRYQGLVPQAIGLTAATAFVMMFVYSTGLIRVTGRLAAGITAATGALCLFYFGAMLFSFFGVNGGMNLIFSSGPLGIALSVFAVGLAAFNLLLDFDFISQGARAEAPKYMEWYGAFGLMVTLIWLYMEILRLLRKLQDRR